MISVDVSKRLRDYDLVLSFEVRPWHCLALVGPTACGKTTTLRIISGLATPDSGTVTLDGRTLVDVQRGINMPPQQRQVGLVFQDYALFPHLSVLGNVAYGARARGKTRREAHEIARRSLEIVHLSGVENVSPTQLSGGQQQRVALARALAGEPRALLMDEPMSALDASTRRQVREQLRQLLSEIRIQTIIVTHDVVDALTLGDTICVMHEGRIIEQGTRAQLLAQPRTNFVAEFLGVNLLNGTASPASEGLCRVRCGGVDFYSFGQANGQVLMTFSPWDVALSLERPDGSAMNAIRGTVKAVTHVGGRTRVTIENGVSFVAEITYSSEQRLGIRIGSEVYASIKASAIRVYQ